MKKGEDGIKERRQSRSVLATLIVLFAVTAFPLNTAADQKDDTSEVGILSRIKTAFLKDNRYFYSTDNLTNLAIGFGIGGVMANTSIDRKFQNQYQEHFHSDFPDIFKVYGEGIVTVPLFTGFALIGELTPDTKAGSLVGEWGRRTLRSYIVGVPPLFLSKWLTGGSRPGEKGKNSSHWSPWSDEDGVSGHAFMGAVPFMTAAQMTDNVYAKTLLYACSGLTAWSRINDDKHFLSQAMLGVWLAYSATSSVNKTEKEFNLDAVPMPVNDGVGVMIFISF
jgi:hypothetical protein